MRSGRSLCDDGQMIVDVGTRRAPRSHDRVLTGAAAGWARRWGVEPTVLRAALGVLGLAGGIGVALYLLAVAFSDPAGDRHDVAERHDARRDLAIGSATAAVLLVARSIGLWPGDGIMVAAVAVAVGVAVVWSPGPRVTTGLPGVWQQRPLVRRIAQTVVGVALLAAGVVSLANRTGGLADVGASASAIAVVVGGLAVFGAQRSDASCTPSMTNAHSTSAKTRWPVCRPTCTTRSSSPSF